MLPGHIQVVRRLLFDALSDDDLHPVGDITSDVELRAFLLDVYDVDLTEPQPALPQLVSDRKRTAASTPA